MSATQILEAIAAELSPEQAVTVGKWFGKPCLKVDGKVFAALWEGDLACKLAGETHTAALQLPGAGLFDPRQQGHPLQEWVQIPAAQAATWSHYARQACRYVAGAAEAQKEALIQSLQQVRGNILASARRLPAERREVVFLGEWSLLDLLAHLAGWDDTNREAVAAIRAGERPGFWKYYDRDWRSYNAMLVARYRREDFAEMVALVEATHRELTGSLQAVPAEEYLTHKKIATLLKAEMKDEEKHYRQIEAFRVE